MKRAHGFTIVELLIVIVVIAILASLSYVGYVGVSNRANNSVVQSDMSNMAKQIRLFYADNGRYPNGGSSVALEGAASSGNVSYIPEIPLKVSSGVYDEPTAAGSANAMYCSGPVVATGEPGFNILSESRSHVRYIYNSESGTKVTSGPMSVAGACLGLGYPRSYSYGYFINSGGWQSWTK